MTRVRELLYQMGFRPKIGSIWYSNSLNMIYTKWLYGRKK